MMRPKSAISAVTPKTVIGLSVVLLMLAAVFGLLNSHKVKTLRTNAANADAARDAAEHRGAAQKRTPETRETTVAGGEAKIAETESNAAKAEAELKQVQKDFRKEVVSLETWLKWINILALPAAVTGSGMVIAVVKRRKTSAK